MRVKRDFVMILISSLQRAWRIDLFALSAQVAYYEFLSIFPLIIVCLSLFGMLPIDNLLDRGIELMEPFVPESVIEFILGWISGIRLSGGVYALLFGVGGVIVTGYATTGSFMHAFRIIEREPKKKRFMTVVLVRFLFSLAATVVVSFVLILWVVGPSILGLLSFLFKVEDIWNWIWFLIRFPLGFIIVALGIALFYNVLGFKEPNFNAKIPGAMIAATLCYVASWGFSKYLSAVPDFNLTYGSLAGIVVFLIWLQLMNLALLFGELWNIESQTMKYPVGMRPPLAK